MMTLDKLKSSIEWLIEQYEQSIMLLEEDIKETAFNNEYLIGELRTYKETVDHLHELLDENNYDEEE